MARQEATAADSGLGIPGIDVWKIIIVISFVICLMCVSIFFARLSWPPLRVFSFEWRGARCENSINRVQTLPTLSWKRRKKAKNEGDKASEMIGNGIQESIGSLLNEREQMICL